jgi:FkbM family methyltransferase
LLDYYAATRRADGQQVFCVQVGANDGVNRDPIHRFFGAPGWRGMLIEPQEDVFRNQLSKTYAGNDRVILENVALSDTDGTKPFYRLAVSNAPWATGLASFDRGQIETHLANGYIARHLAEEGIALPDDLSEAVETLTVQTSTLRSLMAKHSLPSFDVLCVDTEGFDYEILKMAEIETYTPDVILYESQHLSADDRLAAVAFLRRLGYRVYRSEIDALGVRIRLPLAVEARLRLSAAARGLRRRAVLLYARARHA